MLDMIFIIYVCFSYRRIIPSDMVVISMAFMAWCERDETLLETYCNYFPITFSYRYTRQCINGLMQKGRDSIANAMKSSLLCIDQSIWFHSNADTRSLGETTWLLQLQPSSSWLWRRKNNNKFSLWALYTWIFNPLLLSPFRHSYLNKWGRSRFLSWYGTGLFLLKCSSFSTNRGDF